MKIVWHSNAPWVGTGYGQQTATFVPRIRDLGHNVAISAFWGLGGQSLSWEGIKVYPADEKWGNRTLPQIAREYAGEDGLVITLMDVWVLAGDVIGNIPRVASWVPIDHDPMPPRVGDFFRRTGAKPIAMSRFGQQKLIEQGFDPLYVPHGVDTGVFRPRPEARPDLRGLYGIEKDAFVVGVVAANKGISPPRKAFPQTFQAFARFHKKHPDSYLYLHTELSGAHDGMNLGALAAACGIPTSAIHFTPPWMYELGVEPENLSCLYSMFDVLANPSYGEGFGVPIMEAQACGTPVIVTDHSAMPELCGAGWVVDGDDWYNATQGSFYKCPSIDELVEAMEAAYEARGDQQLRDQAREFSLAYDADRVTSEFWVPTLERLAEPVARPLQPLENAA